MRNCFLGKKSQSLIFKENNVVFTWYIVIYKNETFRINLQEVSWKSHRSIIKYPFLYFFVWKNRSKSRISKSHSYIAQEEACKLGTRFPYYGHLMLVVCSVDAPALFIECPSGIHWVFKLCSLSVQVVLIMPFASLRKLLWCIYDTLVILLWYFM